MSDGRDEKLVDLLIKNSTKKNPKPLAELLKDAGFSPMSSTAPVRSDVSPAAPRPISGIESVRGETEMEYVISLLDNRRKLALEMLSDDKMRDSTASQLAGIIDVLTKNHQLLTGKETEKRGVVVNVTTYGDGDPLAAAIIDGEIIDGNKATPQLDSGETPDSSNIKPRKV